MSEDHLDDRKIDEANFFTSLRAIDLTQDELPSFVTSIEGLTKVPNGRRTNSFRWNKAKTIRISLRTPLLGKLSVELVARTRARVKTHALIKIGNDSRYIVANCAPFPVYKFIFNCRDPRTAIDFEFRGRPLSFGLACISIQRND